MNIYYHWNYSDSDLLHWKATVDRSFIDKEEQFYVDWNLKHMKLNKAIHVWPVLEENLNPFNKFLV